MRSLLLDTSIVRQSARRPDGSGLYRTDLTVGVTAMWFWADGYATRRTALAPSGPRAPFSFCDRLLNLRTAVFVGARAVSELTHLRRVKAVRADDRIQTVDVRNSRCGRNVMTAPLPAPYSFQRAACPSGQRGRTRTTCRKRRVSRHRRRAAPLQNCPNYSGATSLPAASALNFSSCTLLRPASGPESL